MADFAQPLLPACPLSVIAAVMQLCDNPKVGGEDQVTDMGGFNDGA
jgi:hypothetical protein